LLRFRYHYQHLFQGALILWACFSLFACQSESTLDLNILQAEIHFSTNQIRTKLGLQPLLPLAELDQVATLYSQDMATRRFFDHKDPDGLGPQERLSQHLPQLVAKNVGENIALRSLEIKDAKLMAAALMKMWRESNEHYKNLINPEYRHLGVGLYLTEERIYASQTFSNGVGLLESELPEQIKSGESLNLRFRYLDESAPNALRVLLYTPDQAARLPVGNGSYYIGKKPLTPNWSDSRHFDLNVHTRLDDGVGTYRLRLGFGEQYFDTSLQFKTHH